MTDEEIFDLAVNIRTWLRQGAIAIKEHLDDPMTVKTKSNRKDLVTNFDKANEKFLDHLIRKYYPQAKIVSEEGFGDQVKDLNGLVFFVDPIDGTLNFVEEQSNFATMIGVYENGVPIVGAILDVIADQLFWGGPTFGVYQNSTQVPKPTDKALENGLFGASGPMLIHDPRIQSLSNMALGTRIIGSAGLEFLKVISGKEAAYVSHLEPWDIAAGRAMLEAFDLKIGLPNGEPVDMLKAQTIAIGTPSAFKTITEAFK